MGYAVTPRDITFSRRKGCARDEKYARDGEGGERGKPEVILR